MQFSNFSFFFLVLVSTVRSFRVPTTVTTGRRDHKRNATADVDMFDLTHTVQRFIRKMRCSEVDQHLGSTFTCKQFKSTSTSQMRIYLAHSSASDLTVVFPDDKRLDDLDGRYHAVAVVDPSPNLGFGHPVIAFYVSKSSRKQCRIQHGKSFSNGRYCVMSSTRKRPGCENKDCEINSLPLVFSASGERRQLLECFYLMKFGRCPQEYRALDATPKPYQEGQAPVCEEGAGNKCDHAMTLFGGWSSEVARPQHEINLFHVHKMLVRNGFAPENIRVFFNSNLTIEQPYVHERLEAKKPNVRNHLRTMCRSECVDSLVLYLNGPTLADGSMLFWDENGNGKVDLDERYSVKELVDDVADCHASQLVILAQQGHAHELARELVLRFGEEADEKRLLISAVDDSAIARRWSQLQPHQSLVNLLDGDDSMAIYGRVHADRFTLAGVETDDGQLSPKEAASRLGCSGQ